MEQTAQNAQPEKRKRGRPRKPQSNEPKPKKKLGRPTREEAEAKKRQRALIALRNDANAFSIGETDKPIPSRAEFIKLIYHYRGNLTRIADEIGITRYYVQKAIEGDDEYLLVYADARELRLDVAEGVIDNALDINDAQTARWFLDRQGAARGYVSKQEIDHNIEITVNAPPQYIPPKSDFDDAELDEEDGDV
jgi:hypothetical protein